MHSPYDVADEPYGADPRLSHICKQRRKSGMEDLHKLIENMDAGAVLVHFSNVIRDLTAEGLTQQVSVVTGWIMEVQEVFGDNKEAQLAYIKEYLRRYRGRAFPVKFDLPLYAKAMSRTGTTKASALTDDQKQALASVKSLKASVDSLKESMAAVKKQLNEVKSSAGTKSKVTCNYCGKEGHIAPKCRANPDSADYDPKHPNAGKGKGDGADE